MHKLLFGFDPQTRGRKEFTKLHLPKVVTEGVLLGIHKRGAVEDDLASVLVEALKGEGQPEEHASCFDTASMMPQLPHAP